VANRRINANRTQGYVAAKVGISRQALSAIERGEQAPRWETIYQLAEALRCEVHDLLPTRGAVRRLTEYPEVVR
jgi:DNA-binding XRE family transcriptional regulator